MRSYSFQDKELNLHMYVNDSSELVVEGLAILTVPRGAQKKRVNHSKNVYFDMRSHSFQDTELKLYRYVNGSPNRVVEGLAILTVLRGAQKLWVNHSKNVNSTCVRTVSKIQS